MDIGPTNPVSPPPKWTAAPVNDVGYGLSVTAGGTIVGTGGGGGASEWTAGTVTSVGTGLTIAAGGELEATGGGGGGAGITMLSSFRAGTIAVGSVGLVSIPQSFDLSPANSCVTVGTNTSNTNTTLAIAWLTSNLKYTLPGVQLIIPAYSLTGTLTAGYNNLYTNSGLLITSTVAHAGISDIGIVLAGPTT